MSDTKQLKDEMLTLKDEMLKLYDMLLDAEVIGAGTETDDGNIIRVDIITPHINVIKLKGSDRQ